QHLQHGQLAVEDQEILSPTNRYNEYVMTHLRKAEGLDLKRLQQWFPDWKTRFTAELQRLLSHGWVEWQGDSLRCTPSGWLVSDHLAESLFAD
ncbi:MAG: hypothetical protein AAF399_06355, partial [Bacteroidota bacterium]